MYLATYLGFSTNPSSSRNSMRNTRFDYQTNLFQVSKGTPQLSTEEVGGKAHNLIKLVRMSDSSIRVPETFVLHCREFSQARREPGELEVSDETKKRISLLLDPNCKYSVRSSANVEDGLDSAYAGKFSTTLNVPGTVEDICRGILVCWNSLINLPNAPEGSSMGVVIMKQIDSSRAGVLFQANPITFSTATHVITASFGQGEGVVGGTQAVDTYYLRESTLEVKSKSIAVKETRLVLDTKNNSVKQEAVAEAQQNIPCLTDAEVQQVARVGKLILKKCKSPQDIEFCFDGAGELYILQTRPITTLHENLVWTPPDNGLWRRNGHSTTPMSKFYSPIWCTGQSLGGYGCTVYCGAAITAMDACDLNGFGYYCMRQVGPRKAPTALPPPIVLRTVMRLASRGSMKRAEEYWTKKLWREFMTVEYPQRKAEWRAKHDEWEARLARVRELSNAELSEELKRVQDYGKDMYTEHAQVTMYNLNSVAWFAMRAMEITKCTAMEAFACIDGFSPFSKGLVGEFRQEVDAIAKNAELRARVHNPALSTDPEFALATWREVEANKEGDAALAPLQHILRICKYRLVDGYDCANSTLVENPCVLFNALVSAIARVEQPEAEPMGVQAFAKIRAKATRAEDQAELDELVAEARLVAPLRDERALLTDLTANGIVHHFLLETGRRISPNDSDKAKLIVYASLEEMQNLLLGRVQADDAFWAEMDAHRVYRDTASIMAAPPAIGGPVLSPGPEYFPTKYMGRSVQCVMFVLAQIFDAPDMEEEAADKHLSSTQNDPKEVVGFPAGANSVRRGRARVITTPEDCALFEQGEICVTRYPSSVINLILHKTNGIVTDMGGILCHAAICAREEGIPCAVGTHTATRRISTGDMIEIDGLRGVVRLL